MVGKYKVRTDLAMENGEKYEKDNVEISGVVIHKSYNQEKDIRTTVVKIESEHGAKMMEKPIGTYITLEAHIWRCRTRGITVRFRWNWRGI